MQFLNFLAGEDKEMKLVHSSMSRYRRGYSTTQEPSLFQIVQNQI